MAAHDHPEYSEKARVRGLFDQLAERLRELPADRQEAFREYLDEQIRKEENYGRDSAAGDQGQRQ